VTECAAAAKVLMAAGVAPERILQEAWSLDTIGNAYFSVDLVRKMGWKRVLVVTNEFHMPRTRRIFDWMAGIYEAEYGGKVIINFKAVADVGLSAEQLAVRRDKEAKSLVAFESRTVPRVDDMKSLASFLFTEHDAYRTGAAVKHHASTAHSLLRETY